ncbi:sensor histidine kinase [Halalkalibacter kiskunsagensis]|uniref:Sensor histidine kinase n=1 Tax=Halalkalibacter kiskunsagensis TaxID=1548599 RepID=A0ABV6KJS0_9BACI
MRKFNLNNVHLKNKLLIIYFLSVFIPILLTNIIFYHVTTGNVKKQKMQDLTLAFEQIANDFSNTVDEAIGVSSTIYTDDTLHDFFETEYETVTDYVIEYESTFRNFNKYSPVYSAIKSITFYTDNHSMLFAGGIEEITENIQNNHWYQDITQLQYSHPIVRRTASIDTFSVIRQLNYFQTNTREKFVKIDLNTEIIRQAFGNIAFQGNIYLLSEHGRIEYTTDSEVPRQHSTYFTDVHSSSKDSTIFEQEFDLNYLDGWKVVGVVSENAILEGVQNSRKFILYLASINFLVPSFIIIWISSSLHARLLRIVRHMKRMKNQNFELIDGVEYKDEIGQLTSEFNRMSQKINDLINDVYIANLQKKDLELKRKQAQLSALQSQINPHFLFNSLETIRMRSLLKKESETAKIIQNMAKLLRNSITWGKDWVTVEEELKIIQCFLEIQQYRFGDKLLFEIEVDEEAKGFMIPNMSLIPFVENASIHGIESKKGNGFLHIKIEKISEGLRFTITDDGVGMDKERLKNLVDSIQTKEDMGESIGVKNVYYRLKLHYGNQFTFDIKSSVGQGTKVQIIFPSKRV